MTKLVFVHGWGFGPYFWDAVRKELSELETSVVDLGFFGPEKYTDGDVYITHSMGLPWVLEKANPKAIVAINGFTKFCTADDWLDGVHPRMLRRMKKQFGNDPQTVWCDFMANCGMDNPFFPAGANLGKLLEGLKYLNDCDVRKRLELFEGKKLFLASQKDRIIPEKLSSASFAQDVIWYKEGNHLLPLFEAKSIAGHIRAFLDTLS